MAQKISRIPRFKYLVVIAVIALLAVLGFTLWRRVYRDGLRVTALNVGQGDAIFVEFPSGQRWLIDGGPDAAVIAELDRLTALSERRLTGLILTHPHADHVTGLIYVLRRYQVDRILMPAATHTTPEFLTFLEEMRSTGISVTPVNHPFVWSGVDNGVVWRWEFLYPEKEFPEPVRDLNDVSVVSRLTFGRQSFLFMGDASTEIEKLIMAEGRDLRSSVLKIGHHGSASSSGDEFIQAVKPSYAVISVGANNRFGHPAPSTVKKLLEADVGLYRTDERGWIQFRSDGKSLTVLSER